MRFQYISDIHLEKLIPKIPINIKSAKHLPLFLAGDIGHIKKPNYGEFLNMASNNWKHVFLISGNHEYNKCYDNVDFEEIDYNIQELVNKIGNITYLNRKCVSYDDYLIIGTTLWTHTPSFYYEKMTEKNKKRILIENEKHRLDSKFIYESIKNAEYKNIKIIVMTHHLPSYKLITPYFLNNTIFNQILFRWVSESDHLIQYPIQKWICGHSHMSLDTNINNVRFLINAATKRIKETH